MSMFTSDHVACASLIIILRETEPGRIPTCDVVDDEAHQLSKVLLVLLL